jgi:hypothetical protein
MKKCLQPYSLPTGLQFRSFVVTDCRKVEIYGSEVVSNGKTFRHIIHGNRSTCLKVEMGDTNVDRMVM